MQAEKGEQEKRPWPPIWPVSRSNVQLLDCDVEEPNAHLFLHPVIEEVKTITTPVPEVDEEKCTLCGKCGEICQFKAIMVIGETILPFPEMCHSCGGCMEVCPEKAITETGRELGVIERGHRNGLEFVHGKLRMGEAMSPPLIRKVRISLGRTSHHHRRPAGDLMPGDRCHEGRRFCPAGHRTHTIRPARSETGCRGGKDPWYSLRTGHKPLGHGR